MIEPIVVVGGGDADGGDADVAVAVAVAEVAAAVVVEIDTPVVVVQTDIAQAAQVRVIEVVNGDLSAYESPAAVASEVQQKVLVQLLEGRV